MMHRIEHPRDRQPIAFFGFTPDDLSDENIDATAERVAEAIQERSSSSSSPSADETKRRANIEA